MLSNEAVIKASQRAALPGSLQTLVHTAGCWVTLEPEVTAAGSFSPFLAIEWDWSCPAFPASCLCSKEVVWTEGKT